MTEASGPRPPRALPALANPSSQRPTRALPPIRSPNKSGEDNHSVPRRTPRRRKEKPPVESSQAHGVDNKVPERRPKESSTTANFSASPQDTSTVTEPGVESRERRRRRTKEPKDQQKNSEGFNKTLISELQNEDDLVNVERADGPVSLTNLPGIATGIGGSAQNDKVYIQTTNGFVSRNRDWIDKRNEIAEHDSVAYGEDRIKPFDIAEQNERGFMYIALALHGALAGFAIFHVIFSYSLYQPDRAQNFLTQYQYLALPAQTVYYITLSILVVSSLDRYDFANKDKHFFDSLVKFDLAAVSVLIYFITFGFSIGLSGLDVWISSGVGITTDSTTSTTTTDSSTIPAILTGSQLDPATTVNTWLIINVLRMVFTALGWLIVAFDPLRNDMKWRSDNPTRLL